MNFEIPAAFAYIGPALEWFWTAVAITTALAVGYAAGCLCKPRVSA